MYRLSIYRGCMAVVIMLLLLTAFCLPNLEAGSAPFYLCIFSLMIDVPFCGFLLYKLIRDYRENGKAQPIKAPSEDSKDNQVD